MDALLCTTCRTCEIAEMYVGLKPLEACPPVAQGIVQTAGDHRLLIAPELNDAYRPCSVTKKPMLSQVTEQYI